MFNRFVLKAAITITVFIIVVLIVGYAYISSGYYNIAATDHHTALTIWAISTLMDNSVRHHAESVSMPPAELLADSVSGFGHYDEMCRDCHGGPGIERSESGEGLYPLAPTLVGIDSVWTQAQLFWIIKNGIKMTGMPEFGSTHSDEQIWHIVAFADHLSHMSNSDYMALRDSLGGESDEEESGE
jgi:mono/diheme cytochrome c family protein